MATYFRRGNWGYNPYKKYKGSGARRRGNFRAARQTRESMNMNIKCNVCFSAKYFRDGDYGAAVVNIYEVLRQNPQFQSFVKLYDQVKVGGVRVKLNVVDAETTLVSANRIRNINVVTAWDRTGLSREQVAFADAADKVIPRNKQDEQAPKKFSPVIGKGLANATGVNKTTLNSYQRWTANPFLYPSDLEEKSQYLSTSNFENAVASFNFDTGHYTVNEDYDGIKCSELFANSNPCLFFESPNCKWKPTLLVGVFTSTFNDNTKSIIQYDDCSPVLFNGEFSIECTFRNLKAAL